MTRRDNLVAVGSIPEGSEQPEAREPREAVNMDELVADQVWDNEYEDEEAARSRFGWVVPSLAVLAIVAWTGFFGWSHQAEALNGATPEEFLGWLRRILMNNLLRAVEQHLKAAKRDVRRPSG